MKADDALLKILACPIDKGPLALLASEEALYNPRLQRRYPILDGIPQLLPSLGEQLSEAEHERAMRQIKETETAEKEEGTEKAEETARAGEAEEAEKMKEIESSEGAEDTEAAAGTAAPGAEAVASGAEPGAGAGS